MDLQTDADDVRSYCRHHELSRPAVGWLSVIVAVAAFELTVVVCFRLSSLPASSFFLFADAAHLLAVVAFGGSILRFLVTVYQRYAPESLRRQCTCKPTCSEYALLALQKYWWPKALVLIVRRVAHTCQQPGYKTDYP